MFGCSRALARLLSKHVPAGSQDAWLRTADDVWCARGWGSAPAGCTHETAEDGGGGGGGGGGGEGVRVHSAVSGDGELSVTEAPAGGGIDVRPAGLMAGEVLRGYVSVWKPALFVRSALDSPEWGDLAARLTAEGALGAGGEFGGTPVTLCTVFGDVADGAKCSAARVAADWLVDAHSGAVHVTAEGPLPAAAALYRPPPLHGYEIGVAAAPPTLLLASRGAYEPYDVRSDPQCTCRRWWRRDCLLD